MKEDILATCVKNFVSKASSSNLRLDGRSFDEFRQVEVHFGKDWGSCQVSFGETKVLSKVTCDVQLPKATRPNEGLLIINVELSPMAALHYEAGPQSDLGVQLNRLLEKFFKESRCIDLESLCIVAEEKVWNLRIDVNVLNSDGNLIGCCSAAVLAALMHFRRPDFTLSGEQVVIHSPLEQDPLPVSLHHHPLAIAFAVFNNGEQVVVDPSSTEERVSQAQLVLAVNTYKELCGLHLSGTALAAPDLILRCAHKAASFSADIINIIKQALAADLQERALGPMGGLAECIKLDRVLSSSFDRSSLCVKGIGKPRTTNTAVDEIISKQNSESEDEVQIVAVSHRSAELRFNKIKTIEEKNMKPWIPSEKGNKWIIEQKKSSSEENEEDTNDDSDSEVEVVKQVTLEDRVIDNIELSGDSEEENTVILKSSDMAKA